MKRILALALTSVMLFTAVACQDGSDTTETPTTGSAAPTEQTTEGTQTENGTEGEEPTDVPSKEGFQDGVIEDHWELPAETVQLIWLNGSPGTVPSDLDIVEAELDKMSEAALNMKVHTLFLDDQSAKLHISSGQDWDMAYSVDWWNNYGEQVRNGYFADITDIVEELTPTLYESIPEMVWDGTRIDGQYYGVPILKDYAAEMFWQFDADLLDDLGIEVPYAMDDYGDVEPILEAVHQAIQDGNPLTENYNYVFERQPLGTDSAFERISAASSVGLPFSAIGTDKAHEIVFFWSHEDYLERLDYHYEWYQKGYLSPEILTQEEIPVYSGVKANQGFYGADAIWSSQDGYRQYISRFNGPTISTSTVTNLTVFNPNSDNLEYALMYTQYVNTDQLYRDMLRYGLEGTHYNYDDSGLVLRDQSKSRDYLPWGFAQGSYALNSVEAAEGVDVDPDMWVKIFEIYEEEAVASDALGFSFDPSSVESQIVAVNSVTEKYRAGLNAGYSNPRETVPLMEAEADAAGLQDILDEAQRQLDTFLEANGITPKHTREY